MPSAKSATPEEFALRLSKAAFLARYWQREHLLLRGALPGFSSPLSPDELAGLALEETVESRIVELRRTGLHVKHGPFEAGDFQVENPFTLLVHAVDYCIEAVAGLRKLVDFIPAWRIDDVMVSYGTDGASVGPHFDHYDVFLLQGHGSKRWRIGQQCDASTALLEHPDLCLLRDFQCEHDYVLEPGDMLYVPPGTAHWGVAVGESITFSIGFRAPRHKDMLARWTDQLLEALDDEAFYADAGREVALRAGEISTTDRSRAREQLHALIDGLADDRWFVELVSEPRHDCSTDDEDILEAQALLDSGEVRLCLNPAAKLAWQSEADAVIAFANGQSLALHAHARVQTALERLCAQWYLEGELLNALRSDAQGRRLIDFLLTTGCIHVE